MKLKKGIMLLAVVLALAACADKDSDEKEKEEKDAQVSTQKESVEKDSKSVVSDYLFVYTTIETEEESILWAVSTNKEKLSEVLEENPDFILKKDKQGKSYIYSYKNIKNNEDKKWVVYFGSKEESNKINNLNDLKVTNELDLYISYEKNK